MSTMDIEIEDKNMLRTRQIAWTAILIGSIGLAVILINAVFNVSLTGARSAIGALQTSEIAKNAENLRKSIAPSATRAPDQPAASAATSDGDRSEVSTAAPRLEPGAIPPSRGGVLQDEAQAPALQGIPESPAQFEKLVNEMLQTKPAEFRPGSAFLTWNGKTNLDQIIPFLKAKPEWRFEIGAHVAPGDLPAADRTLTERRAEAVAGYLGSEGISNIRMTTKGYGSTKPIADNATDLGRLRNQRVEIHVLASQ